MAPHLDAMLNLTEVTKLSYVALAHLK